MCFRRMPVSSPVTKSMSSALFIDPRESGRFIAENANHVKVDATAVTCLSREIVSAMKDGNPISLNEWRGHELHPDVADDRAIEWIFLIDSLNFSFWSEDPSAKYSVNGFTGYWSLCAAVNRSLRDRETGGDDDDTGVDLMDAASYSQITLSQMERIFRSDKPGIRLPLLQERMEILRENGRILTEKFAGRFKNCLTLARHSASALIQLVIQSFPSFRDQTHFKGRQVSFYKRAQILVADIWSCFQGFGDGYFHDIEVLTMFPDYRVPQILAYKGVLTYSSELMSRLKSGVELPFGHEMEVEIRGVSIRAVDLITSEIRSLMSEGDAHRPKTTSVVKEEAGKAKVEQKDDVMLEMNCEKMFPINSLLVDFFLWDLRRKTASHIDAAGIPFHKTRCIFY